MQLLQGSQAPCRWFLGTRKSGTLRQSLPIVRWLFRQCWTLTWARNIVSFCVVGSSCWPQSLDGSLPLPGWFAGRCEGAGRLGSRQECEREEAWRHSPMTIGILFGTFSNAASCCSVLPIGSMSVGLVLSSLFDSFSNGCVLQIMIAAEIFGTMRVFEWQRRHVRSASIQKDQS